MAHKLLLADDSVTIQKVVEIILAEEEFEVKATNNGEEALASISSFKPDVILADIEMPKINGYQLCEKIKQDPLTRNIPVILLAGAFEPINEELVKQVNADDFIIKPFESQELISKIKTSLTASSVVKLEEVEGIVEVEPVGSEEVSVKEGIWPIKDISEPVAGTEELLEISEEAEAEVGEKVEVTEPKIKIPEVEFPSKNEIKEIIKNIVNERISLLLSSFDLEEAVHVSLQPLMKDTVENILRDVTPNLINEIIEKAVDDRISSLLDSIDIKEAVLSSLIPLMKDSVEKILQEVAPDLVEKILKEMLKDSIKSLPKEVEKIIWETIPDLAEMIISKEIERIRSEF